MEYVPITSLSPDNIPPADASIRGIIILAWPYSSSTRQCALLIADPDFRLRSQKGQVRVRFTGPSAQAVAESRIGIGDEVVLALDGASWEADPEATKTPGKSVDGELLFRTRLQLSLVRVAGNVDIHVDAPNSPPQRDGNITTPSRRALADLKPSCNRTNDDLPDYIYSSPTWKRRRLSQRSTFVPTDDPFIDDVEDTLTQNLSFFRSNMQWRYAARTPSPTRKTFNQHTDDHVESSMPQSDERLPGSPSITSVEATIQATDKTTQPQGPLAPHLHPVESAVLPLPSPFPIESRRDPVDLKASTSSAKREEPVEPAVKSPQILPVQFRKSDDELVASQLASQDGDVVHFSTEPAAENPSTPVSKMIGLGDAVIQSPASRVTARSEKEKIMTETYRSLFGFTTSSGSTFPPLRNEAVTPTRATTSFGFIENETRSDNFPRNRATSPSAVPAVAPSVLAEGVSQQPPKYQLPTTPPYRSQQQSNIDIIEIGSSSDEEDGDDEIPTRNALPTLPLPKRERPTLDLTKSRNELDIQPHIEAQKVDSSGGPLELQSPEDVIKDWPQELLPKITTPAIAPEHALQPLAASDNLTGDDLVSQHATQVLDSTLGFDPVEQRAIPDRQEHFTTASRSVEEASLYPRLNLSPSSSQSIGGLISQAAVETALPDNIARILPPTPQLTQDVTFTQLQHPARTKSFIVEDEIMQIATQEEEMPAEPDAAKNTPMRKSPSARPSHVPGIISDWFSPRRSSGARDERIQDSWDEVKHGEMNATQVTSVSWASLQDHLPVTGISTALAYFTPLSKLEELLNPSSQPIYKANTIDVFAVIADGTSEAVRAKTGPRDYYTIFKISDSSLSVHTRIRVEIYRPWKETLPIASVGDAVLLRGFAIKSRNRKPYLLSTDASAWCVWRYSKTSTGPEDSNQPIWARRRAVSSQSVQEEMNGPPLELGEEERLHAARLYEWWVTTSRHDDDALQEDNATDVAGPSVRPVAAKF